ncbi:MAG: 2,3-bisphosphoglycerate-independent phosphoglycerate mutase [Nitrosopumilaceae archaeon]|nr:2,3-bisphosphoglycerate-independent phosphoglycerate mutase [Nitrosopumilaceae archaeon]
MGNFVSNSNMKLIYILIDGVSDGMYKQPRKTPLELAVTPNLDLLMRNGAMAEVIPIKNGIAPESDVAVFNMLGYNFDNYKYPGRGVIEAIGSGIDFTNGDIALRGNFSTIDNNENILDRRAGRNIRKDEALKITKTLENKIKFSIPNTILTILPTIGHRLSLRIRCKEKNLSGNIGNTDPAYDNINGIGVANTGLNFSKIKKCCSLDNKINSQIAAKLVNEFTEKSIAIMKNNEVNKFRVSQNKKPINCILTRDAGDEYPKLIPINQKYGLKFSCIVDMPVEIGIAKILKMRINNSNNIIDYVGKAKSVLEELQQHNVVYVHLKGPDEFGHDGDLEGKTKCIENIDTRFFKFLIENINTNKIAVLVSADHSTPCMNKAHSSDPVPLLISADQIKKDITTKFTETQARKGSLKLLKGHEVLTEIFRLLNSK